MRPARPPKRPDGIPAELTTEDWFELFPFTSHRFHLREGLWTMPAGVEPAGDERIRVTLEAVGGSLDGLTLVDLGCLEGGFALEFARHGASVSGIEFREISTRRCRAAALVMHIDDARFTCADIDAELPRLAEAETQYDVVFASGILYHVPDPLATLTAIRRVCRKVLILDTHVAHPEHNSHDCSDEVTMPAPSGAPYRGRNYIEFPPESNVDERSRMLWASAHNPTSFWPYEGDLVRMLADAGFASAETATVDKSRWAVDPINRVLYVARVG
jgi:SAM-dependent methyltransferase